MSDGCYQKEGTIEHRSRADMPELTTDSHVVLGQSIPSTTPQVTIAPFQLGSLMVFQGRFHDLFCLVINSTGLNFE